MAADQPDLVPEPPPARPARRDAAIEAALRQFDGEQAAAPDRPVAGPRPASWGRRPQLGVALAASLAIVIGVPAAVIVLRDQTPVAVEAPPPMARAEPRSEPDAAAPIDPVPATETETPQARIEPVAPAPSPAAKEERKAATDEPRASFEQSAPPPPAVAAAPPPPPPPPPAPPPPQSAPMLAERSADVAGSDIVVTGSRIQRDERASSSGLASREPSAPDWVLEDRGYATFLTSLQRAVRANDRGAVAKLVHYPLRVNYDGKTRLYRDAAAVRADYEQIFTPRVRRAILDQRFERLFGSSRGLMIGNGAVWFDRLCSSRSCSPPAPVRIFAVNP